MAESIRNLLLARGYADAHEMSQDELGQLWAIVMKVEERRSKPRERRTGDRAATERGSDAVEEWARSLRAHLVQLLTSAWAHVTVEDGIAGVPPDQRGVRAPGHPHTIWQLLEHLRICQADLVEYSRGPGHVSPSFPDGYWPDSDAPGTGEAWDASATQFLNGLQEMVDLVNDRGRVLIEPFAWSDDGHTLLREALILADHNAYHLGQIVQLKKALGGGQRSSWEMP